MNIGDFCAAQSARTPSSAAMPTTASLLTHPHSLSSKSLSLALQTGTMDAGQINGYDNVNNFNGGRRSRDDDRDSRSGSDGVAASGDDGEPPRKKRYHRHTPHQIQELEAMFKECPHPDEKQRLELSRRLCLDSRQVKFWFQNRRTQMKTQLERHENSMLRAENDKLRAENMSIREAMRSPSCSNCGGPAIIGEISVEEQHLRIENARLKDELDRVCALAGKFLGRPVTVPIPIPSSSLELGVGNNGYGGLNIVPPQFAVAVSSPLPAMDGDSGEKSVYVELALAAMDVLVKMARSDEPLWLRRPGGGAAEVLNHDEFRATFTRCTGLTPAGFAAEASRESGVVIINSLALVETLMDSNKWAEMFPCIIAKSSTTDVVSTGMGGTRNGSLQLMNAAFQVLSPLVPVREFNFLRFCKQLADGVWAVVDVSVDAVQEASGRSFPNCLRLPSGCVVEDMPNGYSKVTWVEHVEYDESVIHQLYRPMISAGLGFGARRWVATLQRQCECLAILMSSNILIRDHSVAITNDGRKSMLKLAQRMTNSFFSGVSASSSYKWSKLHTNNVDENVQVMTRKSVDEPGEPPGIVVSATTSVWLPVPPKAVFDFLRDECFRSKWDILSNGGPMQQMARIAKGQDPSNSVSLLRASAGSMLILQETSTDAAVSRVVYAPVDIPAMHLVMNGGDSSYVALLPSGFSVSPDGGGGGGSLMTVAFQILVNSLPKAKLTVESVETVNNLISCTVEKITATLRHDGDHVRHT